MNTQRIQRRRTKGWKAPEGAVYVGRPTIWGNPCKPSEWADDWRECFADGRLGYREFWLADRAADAFRLLLENGELPEISRRLPELRGKTLMCWCDDGMPCHADVLLELLSKMEANDAS